MRLILRLAILCLLGLNFLSVVSFSQEKTSDTTKISEPKKWFETWSLRGYTQFRYNRLLESNKNLKCAQCDGTIGNNGDFSIRRGRLIFSGNLTNNVFFYIQPDFASTISSTNGTTATTTGGVFTLRDAYFDIGLDEQGEYRFRIGQSKMPFGFENLQSSQNRLPLDRADALNSAFPNERDMGVMFYWTPPAIRKLYREIISKGWKGSGDYGVFGIGAYNGQTVNRPELNNSQHYITRLSYPVEFGDQILEIGAQALIGRFVVPRDAQTSGVKYLRGLEYVEKRIAGTIALAPKPIGLLAEWNTGKGPRFLAKNQIDTVNQVVNGDLEGGFVTLFYKIDWNDYHIYPFFRSQYYFGGKKQEQDATYYQVHENCIGIEWQFGSAFELTAEYAMSHRFTSNGRTVADDQRGNLLRLQAQVNY